MSENRSTMQPAEPCVFSAADIKHRMAEHEAAKAAEEIRHMKEQEEKQKAVMEEFHKPPEKTAEQLMQVVMQLVTHTAERGQTEVQVYRFPNVLCSDRGRRINNSEPDWEMTLEGADPRRLTNSGTISSGRLASTSRRKCSSIQGACPATSDCFSPGSKTDLGRFVGTNECASCAKEDDRCRK